MHSQQLHGTEHSGGTKNGCKSVYTSLHEALACVEMGPCKHRPWYIVFRHATVLMSCLYASLTVSKMLPERDEMLLAEHLQCQCGALL